jgi:TolB-like protein
MCWTPQYKHKQAQYVLDTTIHKQTNTICIGHHYTQTNKHNMYWTPLCTNKQAQYVLDTTMCPTHIVLVCVCIVVSNTYCVCLCVYSGVQHILCLCGTPLYTNKQAQYVLDTTMHTQAQYVLDTTIHKQTSTICVGHHYTHTNKHNMCWTPLYTNKQAQYVLDTGVQHILCLFVCV